MEDNIDRLSKKLDKIIEDPNISMNEILSISYKIDKEIEKKFLINQ